jgi:PIN domain nuclease of toxin-antitoxin system
MLLRLLDLLAQKCNVIELSAISYYELKMRNNNQLNLHYFPRVDWVTRQLLEFKWRNQSVIITNGVVDNALS